MSLVDEIIGEEDVKTFYILKNLQCKGWNDRSVMRTEYPITDGRIVVSNGTTPKRESAKRADYALLHNGNPIAIVEAKKSDVHLSTGIQQALKYGNMLDVPFVYCCNGSAFYEHDRLTGKEREIPLDQFPTKDELLERIHSYHNYTPEQLKIVEQPYYWESGMYPPRYYQRRAINETLKHVAQGDKRMLLVMATGTGKTLTAFHIIHCLRKSGAVKKILYLADRNALIDQSVKQDFRPFGKDMVKLTGRNMTTSAEIYLGLYHQFYDYRRAGDNQPYMEYDKNYFDFIIIDECHRGSAKADSEWHKILEYFSDAIQLGLTATPRQDDNVENDNAAYFGEPIYNYSLKQGIEDGFLAPYMTTRISINVDQTGYQPEEGEIDNNGLLMESETVFERSSFGVDLHIDERDMLVAKYVTDKLHDIGRMTKTIVFCNSEEQAGRIRDLLVELNRDMVQVDDRYVMRITSSDAYGKKQLENFIEVNEHFPVIATTVDLLSTGVDCKTCGLIVINQNISSLARFKQIIGRGTRLREDKNKLYFHILDFYDATLHFNDPDFDGEEILVPPPGGGGTGGGETTGPTPPPPPPQKKYHVKGRDVQIVGEQVLYLGKDGKPITENYTVYARRNILGTFASLEDFVKNWNSEQRKSAIVEILEENGVMIDAVREVCPELANTDVFDIVCNLAFGKQNPPTRAERAEKVRRSKFFSKYQGVAKQIIEVLLDKYAQNGIVEFEKRTILSQDPFTQIGTPKAIIRELGNIDEYEKLITEIEHE
ncbi:MAG: DEAD/DEAH box helicase family protein, partial [Bacteroidales bacterium]|nr:DEAD/DEAH box helicase family protein [Bacteroidales bacterium]